MSRLPQLKPAEVIRALRRGGFVEDHQKGSHLYFYNPNTDQWTSVPIHPGDLHRGILKTIIKQTGLTEDEFRKLI